MFKSVTLEVVGEQRLHCESCEQRVERMLTRVPGVNQVRVQARNQCIEVVFDSSALEVVSIAQRLGQAGYDIKVRS